MSDLTGIEKMKLENFLQMGSGYVLDFTNRAFQEFILDCLGIDIYDDKYEYASGSKANRLREFWRKEPNYTVGKLLSDFLEYWKAQKLERQTDSLDEYFSCFWHGFVVWYLHDTENCSRGGLGE